MGMKFEKLGDGEYQLNVNGYTCPHPQIYTKKALEKLKSGDTLELLFDNPSSGESIVSMIENDGNEFIDKINTGGQFKWQIKKA